MIYKLYQDQLQDIEEIEFINTNLNDTAPWFMDIIVPDVIALAKYLKEQGIGTRRAYPTIHNLPFYKVSGDFPVSQYIAEHCLWLPSASKLEDEKIKYICNKISNFYR